MITHYLFPLIISCVSILLLGLFRETCIKKIGSKWWFFILVFESIYFTIVFLVVNTEYLLESRLVELELNNNEGLSKNEIALEKQRVLKKLSKDTARKLSVYTGLIFSSIITFLLFIMDLIRIYLWNKYIKKTNT